MYIRGNLEYRILHINGDRTIWDGLFIEILLENEGIQRKIIIGNIYRPPRDTSDNVSTFFNDIDELLTSFHRTNDVILVGDFNINPMN